MEPEGHAQVRVQIIFFDGFPLFIHPMLFEGLICRDGIHQRGHLLYVALVGRIRLRRCRLFLRILLQPCGTFSHDVVPGHPVGRVGFQSAAICACNLIGPAVAIFRFLRPRYCIGVRRQLLLVDPIALFRLRLRGPPYGYRKFLRPEAESVAIVLPLLCSPQADPRRFLLTGVDEGCRNGHILCGSESVPAVGFRSQRQRADGYPAVFFCGRGV